MFDALETTMLAAAFGAGVVLGGFYFGSLWWTVRRMPAARHPWNLYIVSLTLRLGVVLAGFYAALMHFDWPPLAASLVGFFVVRFVLVRFFKLVSTADSPAQEVVS
jgi:F1F0 ATPase subunit 2